MTKQLADLMYHFLANERIVCLMEVNRVDNEAGHLIAQDRPITTPLRLERKQIIVVAWGFFRNSKKCQLSIHFATF